MEQTKRKLHPSLLLVLDIDEELDSKDLRLEIDRCYSYLGTPVIRTNARAEGATQPENAIRLAVRLGTHRYWHAGQAAEDELWSEIMESWLANQFHKLDNHLKIYNRRQREEGEPELIFTWLEVDMENGACTLRFRLDSTCGIPARESAWVSAVRAAAGTTGALGEGVVQVTLPSKASYQAQYEAGMAAKANRDAAAALAAAKEEAAQAAQVAAEEKAADALFLESPELAAQAALREEVEHDPLTQARIAEAKKAADAEKTAEEIIAERIAEEEHLAEELERKYALPEPDFSLDYSVWEVAYADGTTRCYNANTEAFIEE